MAAPTAFVAGLRKILHSTRAIAGELGLHQFDIALVVESWSGTRVGEGTRTQTVTSLTEAGGMPAKVTPASEKRVALGLAETGEVTIGPMTPVDSVPWSTLTQSALANGYTVKVRLTHRELGGVVYYRITEVDTDRALGVRMRAIPLSE